MRSSAIGAISLLGLLAVPPSASATHQGGAAPPSANGGALYDALPSDGRARSTVTVRGFRVPRTIAPGGTPVVFSFRLRGPVPEARVALHLRTGGRAVARIDAGVRRIGVPLRVRWKPPKRLAEGAYRVVLHVRDPSGRDLRRSARASGRAGLIVRKPPPAPLPSPPVVVVDNGPFPIQGPYTWGGSDAVFGADRGGHIHQGQDLIAAEGTPLVSPEAGTVYWRAFQERGAGHYLVIRTASGDLVFMHLRPGSLLVRKGDTVAAGQRIGDVGSSGRSSTAHLHFEIWPDGWYAKGSKPVNPRPALERWAQGG